MAQLDHEPVLVERDLMHDYSLPVRHASKHVSQSEVESSAAAGGHHVGRQRALDLLDEYRPSGWNLEGRGGMLVQELGEGA